MIGGRELAREGLRAHCEVAESLAQRLGLATGVRTGLRAAFEQWNGEGLPEGLSHEAIPLSSRIVFLARDVEVLHRQGGSEWVTAAVRARRGLAYDPALVDVLLADAAAVLASAQAPSPGRKCSTGNPSHTPGSPMVSSTPSLACSLTSSISSHLSPPDTPGKWPRWRPGQKAQKRPH